MYVHVGTKNAAKEIAKVCHGTLNQEEKKWFRQLSDKSVFICGIHVVNSDLIYTTFTIRKKYQGAPVLLYENL